MNMALTAGKAKLQNHTKNIAATMAALLVDMAPKRNSAMVPLMPISAIAIDGMNVMAA